MESCTKIMKQVCLYSRDEQFLFIQSIYFNMSTYLCVISGKMCRSHRTPVQRLTSVGAYNVFFNGCYTSSRRQKRRAVIPNPQLWNSLSYIPFNLICIAYFHFFRKVFHSNFSVKLISVQNIRS